MRRRGILPSRTEALAALASAGLFAFAFPPFKLFFPVFVCLVPITVAVARLADGEGTGGGAARIGLWFGVLGYGANLYWIAIALLLWTKLAVLGYIGSLVWLAPFLAATTAALFWVRRRTRWPLAILLPVVWVASELVLNYLSDLSFPWLPLGLGVARIPVLAQMAELSGARMVSFWIAAVNGLLADAWLSRGDRKVVLTRIAAVIAVFGVVTVYGVVRMKSIAITPFAKVAVIQPNIPEESKLDRRQDPSEHIGILAQATRVELTRSDPDLVVWPEAALDRFLWQYPHWQDSLRASVAARPTPLLTGAMDSNSPFMMKDDTFRYYNAAYLTDSLGGLGAQPSYRKQFLVPIVERVPFVNPEWFSGIQYFGGFGHGENEAPFRLPFGEVGVMICYESIYPQLSRSYARQGAELLINITNDAWFQRTSAAYQHFAHIPLRAIETRLPIIRSANTGISAYVDPLGRIRAETPIFVPRTATYTIERASIVTPYVRFGDWLGKLCLAITIVLVVAAVRRRSPG